MTKTTGIDFAAIELMDALDLAILVEEEAQERYLEFVDQMQQHHTPEAAEFFQFMAGNEAKHGAQLHERRVKLFGETPRRVTRSMLWDVEAPDYDAPRAFMSPREAMQVALEAERKAHAFFVEALPHLRDAEVKALFEELRDEEVHHQQLVEQELAKLPPDSGPRAEDFADEPVGH